MNSRIVVMRLLATCFLTTIGGGLAVAGVASVQQGAAASGGHNEVSEADRNGDAATLLVGRAMAVEIAAIGDEIDFSTITDLEIVDFDGDGRNDVAVAWLATDNSDMYNNVRMLSIYRGDGAAGFVHVVDLDLYVPNYMIEQLSVFRNGPSDIGVGDFDGDGDPDLAVTPFHGDELWLVENLGGWAFDQHLKFPFGYNSSGSFQTSPEALSADFDGDGRDELVYIADPIQHILGDMIHFWTTDGSIADMERVDWEGTPGAVTVRWTRTLAVADFDGDKHPDLCFTGAADPNETEPLLVFWYGLDTQSGEFSVHVEQPSFICSDVVALQNDLECPPGVLLTDMDGERVEYWAASCDGLFDFYLADAVNGYAGYAQDRGMAGVAADIDGDGFADLVTRQKLGDLDARGQIEVTLSGVDGQSWFHEAPTPISTRGFQDVALGELLRPRNIAVADLFGNALPEIVAGFEAGPAPDGEPGDDDVLRFAYWANSCVGDVTRDGFTDLADLAAMGAAMGGCGADDCYDEDADLNKDGVIDIGDLSVLLGDYGCDCCSGIVDPDPMK